MQYPRPLKHWLERCWPAASLRTYLVAVMLLATLPIAVIMSLQIFMEVRHEQARIEEELARSAMALSQTVERELASSLDALAVLSQSELFQQGRVAALGRLLHGRPRRDWDSIFLFDRDGVLALDTGPPQTKQDSARPLHELHQQVARSGRAAVSGMADHEAAGHRAIAVALPVVQGGTLRYVLGARMGEAVWQRLVSTASVPGGAHAAIFDGQHRLISYSLGGAAPAGTALPGDATASMQGRSSGVHRSSDVDGRIVYAAWQTVPQSGWRVRVALPAGPIDTAHRKAIVAALATSGGSLLLGLLLASLVARRIARPLHRLATRGPAGVGDRIQITEVAMLRDALLRARFEDTPEDTAAHSQGLMELAQEAGRLGFFHYQFAGDRLVWSPGQCKLFDLEALGDGGLRDWFDRIDSGDRERVERQFAGACTLRRERETFEYCVRRRDGSSHWLSSSVMLHYDAEGGAAQMTGVTVDMTDHNDAQRERSQLADRALAARRDAEGTSRSKVEFLTILSHELRNPLGAISAAIDVLDAADPGGPTDVEARAIIARQTRNLVHMMNDLLDVGRVIAGQILLARQPVNLAAVVRRVEETLAVTREAEDHELRLDLRDAWIEGDTVRIEQVATHLLTNAVKYTPAGRAIKVVVGVEQGAAILQVQDAGMGIPAALLPHIFELFVQGQRTLDRRAGSLGIGLTLVRKLVELHGGSVGVESSQEGSRFTVRLPAVQPPRRPEDGDMLPIVRRRKVLVVEDNEDALSALRARLELDGHTVTTAVDGIEGLSRLLKQRPEVAIVDIGLSGLTGFEFARHARAAGYPGRMIALSGYGAECDAQEALVAGFDAYLIKPVDRDRLRSSMRAA